MEILKGYIFTFIYIGFVMLISVIFQKKKFVKSEGARKIVHIGVGLAWFIIYYYLKNTIHFFVVPLIFVFINTFLKTNKSIDLMKREKNDSFGIVFFALSMTIMAITAYFKTDFLAPYAIGFFSMVFADGLAPIVALKYPIVKLGKNKSLGGLLTVIVITLIVIIVVFQIFNISYNIMLLTLIALMGGLLEFIGSNGYDNLTLPLGLSIMVYLLIL